MIFVFDLYINICVIKKLKEQLKIDNQMLK